jgi:hypothetical protein
MDKSESLTNVSPVPRANAPYFYKADKNKVRLPWGCSQSTRLEKQLGGGVSCVVKSTFSVVLSPCVV